MDTIDLPDQIRALREVEPLTDQARDRAAAALRARTAADRRFPTRRTALLTGLVAAGIAAAVVLPTLPLGQDVAPPATASAVAFLNRVADAAERQGGPSWRDAKYWYSESRTFTIPFTDTGSGVGAPETDDRQVWIGHDRPGRSPLSEEARKSFQEVAGAKPGAPDPEMLEPGSFGADAEQQPIMWDDLWDLPTDPSALADLLRQGSAGAGNGADAELFVVAGDMLRESPAPPQLRATLYRVIATVPGVHLVGPVKDALGRSGIAIERGTGPGPAQRYVIDPDTGFMLEEGSVEYGYLATYVKQGPADDDHVVPAGVFP